MSDGVKIFPRGDKYRENFDKIFRKGSIMPCKGKGRKGKKGKKDKK